MNIFTAIDGGVLTPPLHGNNLPGVTRDRVLELSRDDATRVQERPILSITPNGERYKPAARGYGPVARGRSRIVVLVAIGAMVAE